MSAGNRPDLGSTSRCYHWIIFRIRRAKQQPSLLFCDRQARHRRTITTTRQHHGFGSIPEPLARRAHSLSGRRPCPGRRAGPDPPRVPPTVGPRLVELRHAGRAAARRRGGQDPARKRRPGQEGRRGGSHLQAADPRAHRKGRQREHKDGQHGHAGRRRGCGCK